MSSFGRCTGASFTVSKGLFTAVVPARSAIAIHTGALGSGSGRFKSLSVTFRETAATTLGEHIFVGRITELGSWNPSSSIALSAATYPVWSVTISLPANIHFAYKYIRKEADGTVIRESESDPNLQANIVASGSQTITGSWR